VSHGIILSVRQTVIHLLYLWRAQVVWPVPPTVFTQTLCPCREKQTGPVSRPVVRSWAHL